LDILEDQFNSSQLQLHATQESNKTLQNQVRDLKNDNLLLKQRHQYELEKIANIGLEKVQLRQNLEITEERQFNLFLEPPMEVCSRSFSTPITSSSHPSHPSHVSPHANLNHPSHSSHAIRKSPSHSNSLSSTSPTSNSNTTLNVNVNRNSPSPPLHSGSSSPSTSPVEFPPNGASHWRTKKANKSAEEFQGQ